MSQVAQSSTGQQQKQQQQAKKASATRAKVVRDLLDAADNPPEFIRKLLLQQAVMVAGSEAIAFGVQRQTNEEGQETTALAVIHHERPDGSDQKTRDAAVAAFQNLVAPCAEQGKDGAIEVGSPDGGDAQYCLVTVLRNEGEVMAVSAVITRCRDLDRAKQRLNAMQIVAGYFDLFWLKRTVDQTRLAAEQHQNVLQYAGAVSTAEGFDSAASNLCNELANRTGASRVSLGWVKGLHRGDEISEYHSQIKVKALSHTERFDKKQELIVELEKVMEECVDQQEPVRYDPSGNSSAGVTRCAREHSRKHGNVAVLSIPLRRRDEICGVVTLEFPPEQQLDEAKELSIGVAVEVLGPQLFDRFENDRNIFVKLGLSTKWLAKAAVGPKYWTAKLIIIGALAATAALIFIRPMYSVRAGFQFIAVDKQTVCAPFDGKVDQIYFKAGQLVKKGQVIATMNVDEYTNRLITAQKEADSQEAERLANLNTKPSDAARAAAKRDSALAEAENAQLAIDRAKIIAPMTGVLTRNDIYDRRGAPVHLGDPLFEISQGNEENPSIVKIEAEISVSERDIQRVKDIVEKQGRDSARLDGKLATSAKPSDDFDFHITRIVPAGEPKDGENVFKVYADVPNQAPWMHPGLAGEASIDIEKKSVGWIYTHRLWEWLVLKRWHWMP